MYQRKAYVIAGSNGYLGRAMVEEFASVPEALLLLTCRQKNFLLPNTENNRMFVVPGLDMSRSTDAAMLAAEVERVIQGPFDVINCIGSFPGYNPIIEINGDEALEVHKNNYISVYNLAHVLLPLIKRRGGGQFVTFTSHSRYQAYPNMAAFDSAKAAAEQLIRHIANEMSKDGVVANAFALATLATEEEFRLKPHGDHEHWLCPAEVAKQVHHLLKAPNRMINGNVIQLYNYSRSYFHMSYFDRTSPE
jgi:NAD(P)-dependent dehydrogenase (short-subunit alcohol dehydrogenase family)